VEESIPSGQSFWDAVETAENIEFVLTHPNGWEGAQQAQMRDAAIHAGLINDTPSSRARVHFVTEGEVCLQHIYSTEHPPERFSFLGELAFLHQ